MGLLFFATFLGALAGGIAWGIMEPFAPGLNQTAWFAFERNFSIVVGGFIGGAIGGLNGWHSGSKIQALYGLLIGFVVGALGGFVGLSFGGSISSAIFGTASVSSLPGMQRVFGRTVAFIPFGAFIGLAMGASGRTAKRAWIGFLGGAVGGLFAGLSFDLVSTLLGPIVTAAKGGFASTGPDGVPRIEAEIGGPGRASLAVIMGAAVGLFTSLFLMATKSAWLRLMLGRNEGKDWLIDAGQSVIGRSEMAHVPLMSDPNVAPRHAVIDRRGMNYVLVDQGSPIGTWLNGARIQEAVLFDGAIISIGGFNLQFMMKQGAAKRAAEAYRGAHMGAPSTPAPGYAQAPVQAPAASMPTQVMARAPSAPTQAIPSIQPPSLMAMDGPLAGQRFMVSAAMEVGREATGIALSGDAGASRRHASLQPVAGGVQVTDLGSTNGTFVNGQRIQSAMARTGDLIKMGSTTFRVE